MTRRDICLDNLSYSQSTVVATMSAIRPTTNDDAHRSFVERVAVVAVVEYQRLAWLNLPPEIGEEVSLTVGFIYPSFFFGVVRSTYS